GANLILILFRVIGPNCFDRLPERAETFDVGISILRDDSLDPFWMFRSNSESSWRAKVENIDTVTFGWIGYLVKKLINSVGQVVERVVVVCWHFGEAE